MPARSRLSLAKKDIVQVLDAEESRVFTRSQLDAILGLHRNEWRLAQSTTTNKFIEYLVKNSEMKAETFNLPYRPTNRYLWRDVPTLEAIQSLRPEGYFSHFTALQLNGLTEQLPKTVYLNSEQQLTGGGGSLAQESINRTFKRNCRVSNNVTTFHDLRICVVNGQNTGNLGVETIETDEGSRLRTTNIERTLIDITVRPVYSGGPHHVAQVFDAAHDRFSVNKLVSYLRKLEYTYPYHQAIGFYLDRTGRYSDTQLSLLRDLPIEFDFYLDYGLVDPDYNAEWRLYFPKGL